MVCLEGGCWVEKEGLVHHVVVYFVVGQTSFPPPSSRSPLVCYHTFCRLLGCSSNQIWFPQHPSCSITWDRPVNPPFLAPLITVRETKSIQMQHQVNVIIPWNPFHYIFFLISVFLDLFNHNDFIKMNLPIKLRPGEITNLYNRLVTIYSRIKADTDNILTHNDILEVQPPQPLHSHHLGPKLERCTAVVRLFFDETLIPSSHTILLVLSRGVDRWVYMEFVHTTDPSGNLTNR